MPFTDREVKRVEILVTFDLLQGSVAKTAERCSVSAQTVRRWVERRRLAGGVLQVVDKARSGRKQVLSKAASSFALTELLSNKHRGTKGVAEFLVQKNKVKREVHRTTVSRAAKRQAILVGRPIYCARGFPKKQLTADTKAKRLRFCKDFKGTNWSTVLFTDRSKFHFYFPGSAVNPTQWLPEGEARRNQKPNHPLAVNVYLGIKDGAVTELHIVTGTSGQKSTYKNKKGGEARNITSSEYKDVLTETLLPGGEAIFREVGIRSWVFQQDNDPTHKIAKKVISEYNREHDTRIALLVPWPPNSPDLNPIENVWAHVGDIVRRKACKNFGEFKETMARTIKELPREYLSKLAKSMPRRIAACVVAKGDKTKY